MANVDTTYKNADAFGRAAFEVMDTYIQSNLLAGGEPALTTANRILLGDSLDLAQFTVVGLSGGKLVRATYNADPEVAIEPIGLLVHAAESGASNSTIHGEVWLTGCFNVGADSPLVFDASFNTVAKKVAATVGNPNLVFRDRTG